jgi:TldD protein
MNTIMIIRNNYILYAIAFLFFCNVDKISASDTLTSVLKGEMEREFKILKQQPVPPYFIEYRVDDIYNYTIDASFGSLVSNDENRRRLLNTTIKVGNYDFDNSHELESSDGSGVQPIMVGLPVEDKPEALKMAIWQATHYAYRGAADAFNKVKSGMKEDSKKSNVPDFSLEKPQVYYEAPVERELKNKNNWIGRLKKYSEQFLENDKIVSADAILSYVAQRKYLINSEGSSIVQNGSYTQLQIVAITKADDGSFLPLYNSYYSYSPDSLPDDRKIMADIIDMKSKLKMLRNAPLADAYSGPAILSCGAAAVFFHEIFGHRIEGHRLKNKFDSQTFKEQVGEKVLPKYMNIISDPTITKYGLQDMFGYYKYDDQGVVSQKVNIVKDGILINFLMSRCPVNGFPNSNGHGRSQAGKAAVSRQSNLIVESSKTFTDKELRKKLIAECKKQNKEYGFFFDQVVGGFTLTTRYTPNVFNVEPTLVYKIYVDGRPDELVRGVDFIGTPLAIFSEVGATGDQPGVFTGYCGAESGNIPVTAVSPSLFIKKIETQKQPEGFGSTPILPRPDVERIKQQE